MVTPALPRRATLADLLPLRQLWDALMAEASLPYPTYDAGEARELTTQFAAHLAAGDRTPMRMWVVDDGPRVIAFLASEIGQRACGKPRIFARFHYLYVAEAHRHHGHARALIDTALDYADAIGLEVVEASLPHTLGGWVPALTTSVHTVAGIRTMLHTPPPLPPPPPEPVRCGDWLVRNATLADFPLLESFWRALTEEQDPEYPSRDAQTVEGWRALAQQRLARQDAGDPYLYLRIVEGPHGPVGYLSGWAEERAIGAPHRYWMADGLYIEPASRGTGAGTALIQVAMQHAVACGILDLECIALAGDAQWSRRGWTPTLTRYHVNVAEMTAFYTPSPLPSPPKETDHGRHRLQ